MMSFRREERCPKETNDLCLSEAPFVSGRVDNCILIVASFKMHLDMRFFIQLDRLVGSFDSK